MRRPSLKLVEGPRRGKRDLQGCVQVDAGGKEMRLTYSSLCSSLLVE